MGRGDKNLVGGDKNLVGGVYWERGVFFQVRGGMSKFSAGGGDSNPVRKTLPIMAQEKSGKNFSSKPARLLENALPQYKPLKIYPSLKCFSSG